MSWIGQLVIVKYKINCSSWIDIFYLKYLIKAKVTYLKKKLG